MKNFLAIFKCAENSETHKAWKSLSENEQKVRLEKGQESLVQWLEKYRDRIIYNGGPLDENTKIIDSYGMRDAPSKMGEFLIVKATSLEEAAKLFLGHPHFAFFPGDGVEVVECKSRHST